MRSRIVATSVLLAFWLILPLSADAQDPPPPPPPPTPEAAPPPSPPQQVRERPAAVPRPERAREADERAIERPERGNREAAPVREPQPAPAREQQPAERTGAVRRDTVRDNAAREIRTGEESSRRRVPVAEPAAPPAQPATGATTASFEEQGAERRGNVRRPPTDSRGSAVSPRDHAVARVGPPPNRDVDHVYVYPDYWSYGVYYDPFYYGPFQVGYLAYSPWGWTPAFYGYPYGYAGSGYYQPHGYDLGRVKLKVRPRDAEVFVDGYYAGTVDDFDGMWQSLRLDSGAYRIEIRKPGFETLNFDVRVQPDRTITYRGEMKPTP